MSGPAAAEFLQGAYTALQGSDAVPVAAMTAPLTADESKHVPIAVVIVASDLAGNADANAAVAAWLRHVAEGLTAADVTEGGGGYL